MEVFQMTIRAAGSLRQWRADGWTASACFAALSAEPESWGDWDAAWRRYFPKHNLLTRGREIEHLGQLGGSGPWCLIDCDGRTIVTGGGFEPFENGSYSCVEDASEDVPSEDLADYLDHDALEPLDSRSVWIEVPTNWLMIEAANGWQEVVSHRAAVAAETDRIDGRPILYGPPLFQFLAQRALQQKEVASGGSEAEYRATKQIHADWLLTPRPELGGRSPRELILENHGAIQKDLEQRATQWSRQGFAPEGLPEDSAAFRYGGWGTAEVVLYFDLIRAVLEQAWEWLRDTKPESKLGEPQVAGSRLETPTPGESTPAQRLATHLSDVAHHWLNAPEGEEGATSLTPSQIILSERRRIPVTEERPWFARDMEEISAQNSLRAAVRTPCFIWFDAHHMELEDEFAFSMTACRDDWEDMQACGYRV